MRTMLWPLHRRTGESGWSTGERGRKEASRLASEGGKRSTHLLPTPPVDVGDDVQQRVGQVAVAVEGVVPPPDGNVGEVPERRQTGSLTTSPASDQGSAETSRCSSERRLQEPSNRVLPSTTGLLA